MKIVDRKEFLKLPPGTLYLQGEPWAFEGIRVKWDSLIFDGDDGDFVCTTLEEIESNGSDQLFERLEEMKEAGSSYPLDLEMEGRDGLFRRDALYMVYEKEDVVKLRDFFVKLADMQSTPA